MIFLNSTGLIKYFNLLNIIVYLLIINLFGILIMYIDKKKARFGRWRISEKTLIIIGLLGGTIGCMIGMYTFHHKTKKIKFWLGYPTILISEIILITYFLIKY